MLENRNYRDCDISGFHTRIIEIGRWTHEIGTDGKSVVISHTVTPFDGSYGHPVFVKCDQSYFLAHDAEEIYDNIRKFSMMPTDFNARVREKEVLAFKAALTDLGIRYKER